MPVIFHDKALRGLTEASETLVMINKAEFLDKIVHSALNSVHIFFLNDQILFLSLPFEKCNSIGILRPAHSIC